VNRIDIEPRLVLIHFEVNQCYFSYMHYTIYIICTRLAFVSGSRKQWNWRNEWRKSESSRKLGII